MTIYLTLNQVMHIAEEVTGVPLEQLSIWIKGTLTPREIN